MYFANMVFSTVSLAFYQLSTVHMWICHIFSLYVALPRVRPGRVLFLPDEVQRPPVLRLLQRHDVLLGHSAGNGGTPGTGKVRIKSDKGLIVLCT